MSDDQPTKEDWDALAERCEAWKELVMHLEALMVCYRIGSLPRGKTLDRIRVLKTQLGLLT